MLAARKGAVVTPMAIRLPSAICFECRPPHDRARGEQLQHWFAVQAMLGEYMSLKRSTAASSCSSIAADVTSHRPADLHHHYSRHQTATVRIGRVCASFIHQ